MQLSTSVAVDWGFVLDRERKKLSPSNYDKSSSFDLSIRDVLIKSTKKKEDVVTCSNYSVILNPQDTAYLISEEYIRIPKGYVAYVFLKNRLSQRGLLALNTGIIDQEYFGPISTLVTNLSSEKVVIPDAVEDGKLFFRVVFHRICEYEEKPLESMYPSKPWDYTEYKKFCETALMKFPRTFLDVDAVEVKISERIKKELSSFSYVKLGTTIAFVGIFLSLLPLAKDFYFSHKFELSEYVKTKEVTKNELNKLNESVKDLTLQNRKMSNSLLSLQSELAELKKINNKKNKQ